MSVALDSSALLAILLNEEDRDALLDVLDASDRTLMSAVNLHETRIVANSRLSDEGIDRLDRLLEVYQIEITPFDARQAQLAFDGHRRFGKGRHRAKLNLCDCAAYALAKTFDIPLLFKGDDFSRTDVAAALT